MPASLPIMGDLALARKDYAAAEKHYLAVLEIPTQQCGSAQQPGLGDGSVEEGRRSRLAEKANSLAPNQPALMDTLAMLLADAK